MDQAATVSLLETLLIGMSVMFLMALGVVSFFLVYQRKLGLHQQREQEQELRYQRELLRTAVAAEEQERSRIARELHDDVGMLLSTAKLYLSQLRADPSPDERTALVQKASALLDDNLVAVRRISRDLRPVTLEKFGLVAALEDLAQKVNEADTVTVAFETMGKALDLAPEQALALYRIAQELINNTLKHAGASQIDMRLEVTPTALIFCYADDGKGLPGKVRTAAQGLGLKNMESRLATVGGTLQWGEDTTSGMALTIHVPTP